MLAQGWRIPSLQDEDHPPSLALAKARFYNLTASADQFSVVLQHFMIVTTTFDLNGYRILEYKGLVRGIIVRAPTIAQSIVGGLKNIIGGRIGAYTEMCEQTRQQAYDLMIGHATELGANAIIGMRYDASEVVSKDSATEVLCYGTAVVIAKL